MPRPKNEPVAVQSSMPFQELQVSDVQYMLEQYIPDLEILLKHIYQVHKALKDFKPDQKITVDAPLKFYSSFVVNVKL